LVRATSNVIPATFPAFNSFLPPVNNPPALRPPIGVRSTGNSGNSEMFVRVRWMANNVPDHWSAFAVNVPFIRKYATSPNVNRCSNNPDVNTEPSYR
jgi:hypothetical protein